MRVEREKDFAARRQVPLQIAQEEIPFLRSPASFRWPIKIKFDRECSDPIKLLTELGQLLECCDPRNDPGDAEKFEQIAEKRELVDVEPHHGTTEAFQDEQKKSSAAAEIQHAHWRGAMEFQILHAFAIHPQPAIDVRVFSIFLGRTGVAFLDFAQALLVDGCSQPPKWQGKNGALRFTPCPPVS